MPFVVKTILHLSFDKSFVGQKATKSLCRAFSCFQSSARLLAYVHYIVRNGSTNYFPEFTVASAIWDVPQTVTNKTFVWGSAQQLTIVLMRRETESQSIHCILYFCIVPSDKLVRVIS
jgi:hypothetical protein